MNIQKATLIYCGVDKCKIRVYQDSIFIVHLQIWGCANTGNVLLTSRVRLDDEVAILFK